MTKMIKMSLIAAVAVTSMTSVASAQNLEDAIKGVDFSGNLRYRYTNGEATTTDINEYQLQMTLKSKVNDMVTAKVSTTTTDSTGDKSDSTSATAGHAGDADPTGATIAEANFAFALPGATVIAGKQALATPFADGAIDSQQGTGVVALVPVAGVTIAGGLYLNTDAHSTAYNNYVNGLGLAGTTLSDLGLDGNNIAAIAAIGSAANVKYAVWYAKVSEVAIGSNTNSVIAPANVTTDAILATRAGATAMNLNLSAPVGPVNVEVNYAKVDYSLSNNTLNLKELSPTQSRIVVSGDVSGISLAAGYVKVGKDGGDVTLGDTDATANFVMEAFSASALTDTNAFYLAAGMPVGPVTAKIEYGTTSDIDGTDTVDTKFSETKLSVAYAMSKNFTVSAFIANDSSDNAGLDKADTNRIELNYTF